MDEILRCSHHHHRHHRHYNHHRQRRHHHRHHLKLVLKLSYGRIIKIFDEGIYAMPYDRVPVATFQIAVVVVVVAVVVVIVVVVVVVAVVIMVISKLQLLLLLHAAATAIIVSLQWRASHMLAMPSSAACLTHGFTSLQQAAKPC